MVYFLKIFVLGKFVLVTWIILDVIVYVGNFIIVLREVVTWKVGDKVVIVIISYRYF